MTDSDHRIPTELQRSSREPDVLRRQLATWLAARLPSGASPRITDLSATSATGLSSDTILLTAEWDDGAGRQPHDLVARIAPDMADVPVFPSYDLDLQFRVIGDVGRLSSVPVPALFWAEDDPSHVGAPFFVMGRVDGVVPPDLMPYTFGDNWLYDASPEDQARLAASTVEVLAGLHGIDRATETFSYLSFGGAPAGADDSPLRNHVAHTRAWYDWVALESGPSSVIERAFSWIEEHWPDTESPAVVSWGDSRIGNILYDNFEPAAVLDWEMAGLGPCELDLAWLIYSHRVFQDIAGSMGLPGLPEFLRPDDVATEYENRTGHALRDLDFYGTYAALQWAIVFVRTARRSVHFGEREMPAELDDVIVNRDGLEAMFAGAYWTAE
ncbi:MAG TPA: phosphotransferase family protein [Acidimicrobiales bacterium]|jgi:aminoglycoside phosphotransferase (APT) family kinase protein